MDVRGFLRRQGDRLLAIAVVAGICLGTWLYVRESGDVSTPGVTNVVALAVAITFGASLAWRRRAPLVVLGLAIAAAAFATTAPIDAPLALVVALMIATYSVGAQTSGRAAVAGALGVAALIAVAVAKDLGPDQEINDVAVPTLMLGVPWLAGLSIRSRHEREAALERARLDHAKAAVAVERARIARDLHDAVAHSIGVVILQARGARRTMQTDPGSALDALDTIEATGSEALAEMRELVGVLREDGEELALSPPPSLRHIETLVARVRDAGLPVNLSIEGTPVDLPAGLDASAYRIVQEALTNALAHAGPATATVLIRYGVESIDLEIGDSGVGPGTFGPDGHGLVGMRQRVSLYEGRLETMPRPGGGFVVRATLPRRLAGR